MRMEKVNSTGLLMPEFLHPNAVYDPLRVEFKTRFIFTNLVD